MAQHDKLMTKAAHMDFNEFLESFKKGQTRSDLRRLLGMRLEGADVPEALAATANYLEAYADELLRAYHERSLHELD